MKNNGQISRFAVCGLAAAALFLACLPASAVQKGEALVTAVQGSASYTSATGGSSALAIGTVLHDGDTVNTGVGATVDLDLGKNGGGLKVKSNSELKIGTLNIIADDMVETELELNKGSITGNVKKVAAASTYNVKTPKAVAGIRGTTFDINVETGVITVSQGSVIVQFVVNGVKSPPVLVQAGQTVSPPTTPGGAATPVTASAAALAAVGTDAKNTVTLTLNNGPTTATGTAAPVVPVITVPTSYTSSTGTTVNGATVNLNNKD